MTMMTGRFKRHHPTRLFQETALLRIDDTCRPGTVLAQFDNMALTESHHWWVFDLKDFEITYTFFLGLEFYSVNVSWDGNHYRK